MSSFVRGLVLASLSVSVIALTACGTTQSAANMTNPSEASRVDSILERAAREAKASGNKTETVLLLEKIYQRNPDDAAVATSYGQALREDEQLNRARQILFPFTEGKNAYPDAVTELSMVQLALGQYKEAELTGRRAVELDTKSGRSYLALGTALDAQNYHEQAEVAFRRGIDNWQGDPAPIMNNLALNLASQNKLDQAIDMLKKAKQISPGRVEIERNLRIISTLKETADEYTIKQAAEKQDRSAPVIEKSEPAIEMPAPKTLEPVKKTGVKTDVKKQTREEIDNKQLPKKNSVEKPLSEDFDSSAPSPTNSRGSKQNFNRN